MKAFKIILLIAGIFSFFLALISLSMKSELGLIGVIAMSLLFFIISFVCLFFSKELFINSVDQNKEYKKENVLLIKEIKDKKEQIEVLDNRLHELSGQVNGLYKEKQKLEKEKEEYLKTIGEYKKDFGIDSISTIDNMEGIEFENFIAKLLKKHGFKNVKTTPASNDYGIDVLAEKDHVKYAFQCKNYADDVGNKAIQEAYSGKQYYNCHIGVVVTNRYFTRQAQELAKKNDILLWDRNKLISMIEKM